MFSRSHISRRAREKKDHLLCGAVAPVLELLEGRRLLSAGALDPSFNAQSTTDYGYQTERWGAEEATGQSVATQGDKTVVAAEIRSASDETDQIGIARYLSNGALDTTFGDAGRMVVDIQPSVTSKMTVLTDGDTIYVAGGMSTASSASDLFLVRISGSGTIHTASLSLPGDQNVMGAVLKNHEVYAAGSTDGLVFLAKFDSSGVLVNEFGQTDGTDDGLQTSYIGGWGEAYDVALQGDNFVLAGSLDFYPALIRLDSTGTLDTTFDEDGVTNTSVHAAAFFLGVAVGPDNALYTTGAYVEDGNLQLELLRYSANGALDTTFGDVVDADTAAHRQFATITADFGQQYIGFDVQIDANAKIVTTGYFQPDPNSVDTQVFIARFNANGTLDSTFGTGGYTLTSVTPTDALVHSEQGVSLALQSDGKMLVAGSANVDALLLRYGGDEVAAAPATPVFIDSTGNLVVPGTAGDDTLIVTSLADGYHVTFNGVDSGAFNPSGHIIVQGKAGNDSITIDASVTIGTVITGGAGNDTISGGSGADSISGGDGNDLISGNAGADTLRGGNGDDSLDGGSGNDLLTGNAGNDYLAGGADNDTLNGGADDDTSLGGTGDDSISNDDGNDSLCGGAGNDTLRCGAGNDIANGDAGDDLIVGGTGDDSLDGGIGDDTINGGLGNDTISGGDGNDSITGGDGDDNLSGGEGNNIITGGDGNDVITAGAGNDTISGGLGNDAINGGGGSNALNGNDGDDSLTAGTGADVINGGNGNDYVDAGAGADLISGGAGSDIVIGGAGDDTISGGDGRDILIGGTGADSIVGNAEDDILIAGTTCYDANLAAINAIMAEWTGTNTFAQRVSNIRNGSGTATRANGNYFFNPSGTGATVFDDGAIDHLTGSTGSDLFYFNNDGLVNDVITDFKAGESAFDIN